MNETLATLPSANALTIDELNCAPWPLLNDDRPCCRLSVFVQFMLLTQTASKRARLPSMAALKMAGLSASTRMRSDWLVIEPAAKLAPEVSNWPSGARPLG